MEWLVQMKAHKNSGWRDWVWRVLLTVGFLYVVFHGVGVHGIVQGSVLFKWRQARMPVDLNQLHAFWLVFFGCVLSFMVLMWIMYLRFKQLTPAGFRVLFAATVCLYIGSGHFFKKWVVGIDSTFEKYELVLTGKTIDMSVLSHLHSIAPNSAIMSKGGDRRVWIPPQWEDCTDEAISILAAEGYEVRRGNGTP